MSVRSDTSTNAFAHQEVKNSRLYEYNESQNMMGICWVNMMGSVGVQEVSGTFNIYLAFSVFHVTLQYRSQTSLSDTPSSNLDGVIVKAHWQRQFLIWTAFAKPLHNPNYFREKSGLLIIDMWPWACHPQFRNIYVKYFSTEEYSLLRDAQEVALNRRGEGSFDFSWTMFSVF